MQDIGELIPTADAIEAYAEEHLFDGFGLMFSGVDSHTNQPFAREFSE